MLFHGFWVAGDAENELSMRNGIEDIGGNIFRILPHPLPQDDEQNQAQCQQPAAEVEKRTEGEAGRQNIPPTQGLTKNAASIVKRARLVFRPRKCSGEARKRAAFRSGRVTPMQRP